MGAFRRCLRCDVDAVSRCGRCDAALCRRHQPRAGGRCRACERDYHDDALARNRMKAVLGLPPAAVTTAAVLAIMLPFAAGFGAAVAIAASAAIAGSGIAGLLFRAVDRAARAQFLREHGRPLPTARVVRLLPRG